MGWIIVPNTTRRQMIEQETRPFSTPSKIDGRPATTTVKWIAHCFKGVVSGTLWGVVEQTTTMDDDKSVVRTVRTIACTLLRCYRMKGGGMEWGANQMSEHSGPNEVSCPLSYLKLASPEPATGYAVEWRERVRQHHAARKASRAKVAA